VIRARPRQEVKLWFMDEARVGQKGRDARVWFERGRRPAAPTERRYRRVYINCAVRPGTDAFALVLPKVSTAAMSLFLEHFAASLSPGAHAIVVLDQAG